MNGRERWLAVYQLYREVTAASVVGEVCVYCGDPAQTWDHVIARSQGGPDEPSNLMPVCRTCNGQKTAQSLDTWEERLAKTHERTGRQLVGIARLRGGADLLHVRFIEPRAMADFKTKIALRRGSTEVVIHVADEAFRLNGRYDRDYLLLLGQNNPDYFTVTAA